MAKANFRFSTDILKRLGEELNPTLDQGVLELAKNSYDADAHTCRIELIQSPKKAASIKIVDDGDGMTLDEIRDGWLVLGHSSKTKRRKTRMGRVPAGSKGLGRLAALRLGGSVILNSYPKKQKDKAYHVEINWEDFDNSDLVDDIDIEIKTTKRKAGQINGTEIILDDINKVFSRSDVKKLARSLILLADPFGDDPYGFEPILNAEEFKDLEELVNKRYFSESDFHLVASIDENGKGKAKVVDWKGKTLFSAAHKVLTSNKESKNYNCPPANFDLWVFILDKAVFSHKSSTVQEVREWLQSFGGIHLYENNLRVSPYGNPGNDWLDINLRRVQNPEVRPGTNTSIGRVSVTDRKGLLEQKTDRSGYIETDAFRELRLFAKDALEWMAKERLALRDKRKRKEKREAPKESTKSKDKVVEAIKKIPSKSQDVIKQAVEELEKSKDREINILKKEVQLYRTLSTAGITAATFAHESSGNPIKAITQATKAIERRGKEQYPTKYDKILKKPVEGIKKAISSLSVLGEFTLKLLDHSKRRIGRVNIHDVINNVSGTFSPFLDGRDVKLKLKLSNSNPFLRGSEAEVESIIANLLNNSLNALEKTTSKERIIEISTDIAEDLLQIKVVDNGPGIIDMDVRDIWLPGYSTVPNGTGLGLTIVKDAVTDLDGDVTAVPKGKLGGAEFIIELPIIGV